MLISNKNAWVRCWIWWWGVIGVFVSIRSISKQITKGLVFFFFFLLKIGSYSNLEEINLCRCSWSKSGNFWKDSLYLLQDIVGHNWTFHIISSQKHQVRRQELSSLIMVIHVCFTQHETYMYDHVDLQQRTLYFKSLNIRKYRCLKRTAGDHTHFFCTSFSWRSPSMSPASRAPTSIHQKAACGTAGRRKKRTNKMRSWQTNSQAW